MDTARSALAQPIRVGAVTLPNRFIMGSMHTGLEGCPERFDELARFYAERARGGVALIVTGGFAPNHAGRMKEEASTFDSPAQVPAHRKITEAVHQAGGRIVLQILHAGRYGYHPAIVAPSPIRSPINRDTPAELDDTAILATVADYARTARLAVAAGYDGVEVMGSEGYLIAQFLAPRTNRRTDRWGGGMANRARFPLAVTAAVRQAVGPDRLLLYRISALDLVEGGLEPDEVLWLGNELALGGADALTTGIGWHEAAIPTIAGVVPHAAFAAAITRLKSGVPIPVAASNRINLPEVAERLVAEGSADLVALARPFLADPALVRKVLAGRPDLVTVCLACNQACLDHYFTDRVVACAVNPRAAHEADFQDAPTGTTKSIAVVGAGMAGLAFAIEAARRGHHVTVFEARPQVGGQFRLAARVPGKTDYGRTIRSFRRQAEEQGVAFRLGQTMDGPALLELPFDEVVVATGVAPRRLDLPGGDDPRVVDYTAILEGRVVAGEKVVIIGGGGIGHDVALFLGHGDTFEAEDIGGFARRWGLFAPPHPTAARRDIVMVKRSPGPFGRSLGKTTGWILRQELRDFQVRQIAGATYLSVDPEGLRIAVDSREEVLPADTIVVCAGQTSQRGLVEDLERAGRPVHVIGGARLAGELDARRAVQEGTRLGCAI